MNIAGALVAILLPNRLLDLKWPFFVSFGFPGPFGQGLKVHIFHEEAVCISNQVIGQAFMALLYDGGPLPADGLQPKQDLPVGL